MVDSLSRSSVGTVRQVVEKFEERFEPRKSFQPEVTIDTKPSTSTTATTSEVRYALPSPTDTPYRTPSSSRSRQTSRTYEDLSPATTPPPLPREIIGRGSNESMDAALREDLPLSDPRRFTPTLHASLVSEILSLRRDAETRTRDIETLEQSFHDAQVQNQSLNSLLLAATRETRQVKRQMQILEGGTLSAINDLAKERDDAIKDATELRARIEQSQKKLKNHEDTMERVQEQWQKEKDSWHIEKRGLETKIHITEGRLKIVLSEVANAQFGHSAEDLQSPRRSQSRNSLIGSPRKRDSAIARRQSGNSIVSDHIGGRGSVLSFAHGDSTNLADELALEDIEEDYMGHSDEEYHKSPDHFLEQAIRPSSRVSLKARKVLGMPIDLSEFEAAEREKIVPADTLSLISEQTREAPRPNPYVERGTQYSRPSSPLLSPDRMLETPVQRHRESVDASRASKTLSVISQDSAQYSVDTSDNAWEENLQNQPIMVSSGCQTVEQLPNPPLTPRPEHLLPTIRETVETREISVQTDSPPQIFAPTPVAVHKRTDTVQTSGSADLHIPTIAIIPPTSRPVTPDELAVKLPPRTKNAGCQVEPHLLCDYNSKGIQTDDIRIDKRNMVPPVPTVPPPPLPNSAPPSSFGKARGQAFNRKNNPNAPNSSIRRTGPAQSLPPINDDGPLNDRQDIGRPVRSSSMFAGFDDIEEFEDLEDDVFQDDEFFNRPMTKLVLSRGKILAATKDLDDIEESEAAVAAGKRFALEQIRRSEENDRDFEIGSQSQIKPILKATKPVKRVLSASKSANMRRTALISSGTAAHQTKSPLTSMGSTDLVKPPVPIPVRYSSARVGKSVSDGGRSSRASSNASPTRNPRRVSKPGLRKARSGPAMSPASQTRRPRSKSPPLDERVSIVPDMPNFRMPKEQREPPRFSSGYATTFGATAQLPSVEHMAMRDPTNDNSDVFMNQSTTVVDAIAQTMVGEWMFKYVRRRKSFGKPEKGWDPSKSVEEMSSGASTGVRHKRWVWLAPYERSVMWSSKQPTDGTSLLGKSGRKCKCSHRLEVIPKLTCAVTIKSVLDVKDDNPMPKGSVTGPHFNRSILILTPQRALKFTATTQDRHYIWLTALSFLSHSPISMNDLAPLPPVPPEDPMNVNTSPSASLGGSLRRRPIRDSIRIAKGSNARPQFRSFTADGIPTMSEYERPQTMEQYDPLNDAAMPPVIRRYHNRKRSNTAPKPTASAFRALLSRDTGLSQNAPSTAVTSDRATLDRAPLTPSLGIPSMPSSRRGSEASAMGRPPLVPPIPNLDMPLRLFDTASNSSHAASMTMRMDAFMADQHRQAMMRSIPPRGPARNLRLSRPSMRNLKDPSTSSWLNQEPTFRDGMSPVDSTTLPTPTEMRFSESTGRGSSEAGGYYR